MKRLLPLFIVLFLLFACKAPPKLPVYGKEYIQTDNGYDTIINKLATFEFIDQAGEVVNNATFSDKIFITDFFFTSCPTICPVMTKNMAYIQSKLDVYPNIRFLSHTVDPLNDTPNKMAKYISDLQSKNISIDLDNWDFVTGDKNEIYEIARSYFVNASKDPLAAGGFLHSEYFVLVDKEGRVRSGIDKNNNVVGVYDGTNEAQMKDLVNDVKVLMAEYKRSKKTNYNKTFFYDIGIPQSVKTEDKEEYFEDPRTSWGYDYEIREVNRLIREGKTESSIITYKKSIELMEVLDEVRDKIGLKYPFE